MVVNGRVRAGVRVVVLVCDCGRTWRGQDWARWEVTMGGFGWSRKINVAATCKDRLK